jgi:anionic cell wall polymer biosynthesis LytR-Cps2A-Psr (LCP) family protein
MLTSIIRDAIVRKYIATDDNEKFTRINYVYNDYGPDALCKTISEHLGVRIEKYIIFTFRQVANIVDYLGGVQIELNSAEVDALKLDVEEGTVTDPDGNDIRSRGIHKPGLYTFKTTDKADKSHSKSTGGTSAVLYMRIRKAGGGGDFMRTQRARNVLSLLADKCRTMTWDEAQALANNILDNNNHTNMNLADMLQAAEQAYSLRDCTIEELRIPHNDNAVRPITFAAMMTEEINWPYCRLKMADYLQSSWLVADDEDDDEF